MKKIFVPTDFSRNAIRYAAALAELTQSRLILYHAFSMPDGVTDVPYPYQELEKQKQNDLKALKKIAEGLEHTLPAGVEVYQTSNFGSTRDEIAKAAKRKGADLIIMGKKGETNVLERLMGSVASGVVRHTAIPAIVVPEKYSFESVHKIVVASESADSFSKPVVQTLKYITSFFKADTILLKILDAYEYFMPYELRDVREIEEQIKDIPHHFEYELSENISKGLNKVAREIRADLIVIMPREHGLIARIFQSSATRKLALFTEVPLLVLPSRLNARRLAGIFERQAEAFGANKGKVHVAI